MQKRHKRLSFANIFYCIFVISSLRAFRISKKIFNRSIITGDRALHDKFEVNPYSLTQEELEALQSYDKLEVKVERLVKDVLVQKALNNSLRYKL